MNPRISRLTCIFLLLFLVVAPALAKRSAPKPVAPVVVGSVQYSVPLWEMGFVVATDTATRKELWRVRVYEVPIDPNLEEDVQHVFITSLSLDGGALIVTNEKGDTYALDLATRKVTKRK